MRQLHTYHSGKTVIRPSTSHTRLSDGRVVLRGSAEDAMDRFGFLPGDDLRARPPVSWVDQIHDAVWAEGVADA